MDSAFTPAPYPSLTLRDLRQLRATGTATTAHLTELDRRIAVDAGNHARATNGERLHGKVGARLYRENGGQS